MLWQESKWQATGEPELVNYLVMGIPTSPGKRTVWLCLHAVFKPDLCLWTLGEQLHASWVQLLQQPQLVLELAPVHERRVGSSRKILGLENSGKNLRTQAGVTRPCM